MATNELDLHNNKVAQLIEYGVAGSVCDVEFLYEDYRYNQVQIWQYIYFPTKNVMLDSNAQSINPTKAAKMKKYLTSGLVRKILPCEICLFDTIILLLQEPILPAMLEVTIVK